MLPTTKNDSIKKPGGEKIIRLISIKNFIVKIIRIM